MLTSTPMITIAHCKGCGRIVEQAGRSKNTCHECRAEKHRKTMALKQEPDFLILQDGDLREDGSTPHSPGSEGKIRVLTYRAQSEQRMFHPKDGVRDPESEIGCPKFIRVGGMRRGSFRIQSAGPRKRNNLTDILAMTIALGGGNC